MNKETFDLLSMLEDLGVDMEWKFRMSISGSHVMLIHRDYEKHTDIPVVEFIK